MEKLEFRDTLGKVMNISVIGRFSIPETEKTYIMYEYVSNDDEKYGHVLFGEVIVEDDNYRVLGILPEEENVVLAYYNEILNQLGSE